MRHTAFRQTIWIAIAATVTSFVTAACPAFAFADDAKQVFDSLFAGKIKAVAATIDRADDIALARNMLALATTSTNQPALLALLCDAAHDLAAKHADGYATGVEAQQLLADTVEEKRPAAREKLVALLTRQSTAGKPDEREPAGEKLIDLLTTMGDEKAEKKQYTEAAGDYRRAVAVSTQRKSASLDEVKAKLEWATGRDRTMKRLAQLQEKLLKDADHATAEEIVKLYVVELDDPASAVPYLNRVKDEQLKRLVPLAAKSISESDEVACLSLGEWYHGLGKGASSAAKLPLLRRAIAALDRCVAIHASEDVLRIKATVLLKEANEAMQAATKLTVAAPKRMQSIDLIPELTRLSVQGWSSKGKSVVADMEVTRRVELPVTATGNFVLRTKVSRLRGSGHLIISFPCGEGNGSAVIDQADDIAAIGGGLRELNGKDYDQNEAFVKGARLTNGKPSLLEVKVDFKGESVKVDIRLDDKPYIQWTGRHHELNLTSGSWKMQDQRKFGLGGAGTFEFHSIDLRATTGELKPVN